MALKLLYKMYYQQKIHESLSPTFIEKKKINFYEGKIKKYYLNHISEIREEVQKYFENRKNSFVGWSVEYYVETNTKYNEFIDALVKKIEECENIVEDETLLEFDEEEQALYDEITYMFKELVPVPDIRDDMGEIEKLT